MEEKRLLPPTISGSSQPRTHSKEDEETSTSPTKGKKSENPEVDKAEVEAM